MDIELILSMYEDDYNPSSMVPGPRNMYSKGQLVQPSDDGSRPGYRGKKFTEAEKKANIDIWEKNTGLKIEDQNKNVQGKISRGETTGKAGTGKYGKKTFNQLLENKDFTDFFKKDYPQYNLKNLLKGLDDPKTISTTKGILKSAVQAHETYLDLQEKVPKNYIREKDLEKLLDIDLKILFNFRFNELAECLSLNLILNTAFAEPGITLSA